MTPTLLKPWSYFPLGLRAYRDTFRFAGRARRLEFGEFYILSMFLGLVITLPGMWGLEIETGDYYQTALINQIVSDGLRLAVTLPLLALMARRIQDFDMPGWAFAPLMVYVLVVNEWKSLSFVMDVERPHWAFQLAVLPIVVAMMIAWFIPGTLGPNRYGPDPHLDASEPRGDAALNP